MTIQKSQELIRQKSIAELGPTEKVVSRLSRVKDLPDFMVESTSFERLQSVKNSLNFKFRLTEKKQAG